MNHQPTWIMGYSELAKHLPGFSVRRLRRLVAEGAIPYRRLGHRSIVFRKQDVDLALGCAISLSDPHVHL